MPNRQPSPVPAIALAIAVAPVFAPRAGEVASPPAGVAVPRQTPAASPQEPRADGTVSVVVASSGGTAAGSVATELVTRALEPLDAGGDAAAGRRPAQASSPTAPPPVSAIYARPLPLVEALERSGERSRRLWISQAYWKVSAGFAILRWSTEALERLELIAPGGDPHDRAVLDVALAAGRADLADARAELVAAQQELVDLIRLPPGDPLPWPVDRPLAGPYQTHFETLFATRPATGRIRAIVRMLPAKHEALEARAAAVMAAQKAMQMAEADHAKGQRPIEAVTAAHAALVGQQREFIAALKAYNLDIAEYAMSVADLSVPDDRFVSMLIGTPIQWRPQATGSPTPAAPVAPSQSPAAAAPPGN